MPCREWTPLKYVQVGRLFYRAYVAPADDVELDGIRYGGLCDHDHMLIVVSDDVDPSQRDNAVELARWEAEAAVKAGTVLGLPAKDYGDDLPPVN